MTRRPGVFLDRDGTIARYMAYCVRSEDFQLLSGAGQAIRTLNQAGLPVVVVTNQSAVARGWLTTERLEQIHAKMRRALQRFGARVDAVYVCPHHPDARCPCRKPGTALLHRAAEKLHLSLPDCYMIGDRLLDIRSGRDAGATTVLVRSGHPPELRDGVEPDYEAVTLDEAVRWILRQERSHGRPRDLQLSRAGAR